ncbi:hypothetical protein QBZ16_001978 [Prototheca wickerhamii]|uniref:Enhancer of polycomb-like protein n=1 Tax=Prototheca wickerhamii TaxID=3111 RepID=A0AAD9IJR0_PROWI|nr:hypothetical protein QBZ16_001978 [Prototheca wickerhamii]
MPHLATRQSTSGGGAAPRGAGSALKRSRSLWKVRPLLIDEELPIFVEGRDDLALLAYDDGEFARWMQGVATGRESAAGAAPYPLIVQDPELRTILEIRGPSEDARGADAGGQARAGRAGDGPEAIAVPGVRVLPPEEQPDLMLERGEAPPVIQLRTGLADEAELGSADGVMPSGVAAPGVSTAAPLPPQLERDPPYSRYVQPTPDELELAIEYDLDEDDEAWLARYNAEARRAKSRVARRPLAGEWMEHLMDRMEKEYTARVQRQPERWLLVPGLEPDAPPRVALPPVHELFDVERCLATPGINHYEPIIRRVYEHWRAKREARALPLIQRLWYEAPWHRAARDEAAGALSAEGAAAAHAPAELPFAESGAPSALAHVRRRKLDPLETRARFEDIRRDLEALRTLAERVHRREKLKIAELDLFRREHAARLARRAEGGARARGARKRVRLAASPPRLHGPQALARSGGRARRAAGARQGLAADPAAVAALAAARRASAEPPDSSSGPGTDAESGQALARRRRRGGR